MAMALLPVSELCPIGVYVYFWPNSMLLCDYVSVSRFEISFCVRQASLIGSQAILTIHAFCLPVTFMIFFEFCEECHWNFRVIVLSLHITFCITITHIVLIFLVQKCRKSFYLLSFSVSFLCFYCKKFILFDSFLYLSSISLWKPYGWDCFPYFLLNTFLTDISKSY